MDESVEPGPGFISTLPIINIEYSTYKRNTAFTFGVKLCKKKSEANRHVHRKLVNNISIYGQFSGREYDGPN